MSTENTTQLSRGQQVMSVTFNPGQREDIAAIKQIFADAFDEVTKWCQVRRDAVNAATGNEPYDDLSVKGQLNDISRLEAIAKTNLETAQMYAVKAVTR